MAIAQSEAFTFLVRSSLATPLPTSGSESSSYSLSSPVRTPTPSNVCGTLTALNIVKEPFILILKVRKYFVSDFTIGGMITYSRPFPL